MGVQARLAPRAVADAIPNTVYAGVEDAAIFRSTDGGKNWHELPGLRQQQGDKWAPGAGGMGLHTILIDPTNPKRIYIAISAGRRVPHRRRRASRGSRSTAA